MIVKRHFNKVIRTGRVRILRAAGERLGRDLPGRVVRVGDVDPLARRGRQAGQRAALVTGGDPVAVGVRLVVERVVGVVVGLGAVGLGQQLAAVAVGRQGAGVAGLRRISTRGPGVRLEATLGAGGPGDGDRTIRGNCRRRLPGSGPAEAEWPLNCRG